MIKKFVAFFLAFLFVFPVQAVFAATEEIAPDTSEGGCSPSIPVFLYESGEGGVLAVAPIDQNVLVWSYATNTEQILIGFMDASRTEEASTSSESDQNFQLTPMGVVLVPLVADSGVASSTPGCGEGVGQRIFIGQFEDANLIYLNARYQSPTQGRFISQDPSFLAVGSPTLKEKTGVELPQYLANPQSMNSYSYANGNPIRFKDPTGNWWEISGSVYVPGRAFSTGIRFDSNGVDFFMSGGSGYGAGGGLELAWAPGASLSHQREAAISATGEYAYGVGGRVTQNILAYSPEQKKAIPNGGPAGAIVIGAGGGVGIQQELSSPIPYLTWGTTNSSVKTQTVGNNQTYLSQSPTQTHQTTAPNYNNNRSSGGGSSFNQALSGLQSALSRLSVALGSFIKSR